MDKSMVALLGSLGVLVLALGAVGASHMSLSQRVTVLEGELAKAQVAVPGEAEGAAVTPERGADPSGATPKANERAVKDMAAALREAQADGSVITEDEALAIAEAVVEDTFDRKSEERRAQETDKWMELARQKMQVDIEDFGEAEDLTSAQVEKTTEALVDAMQAGRVLSEQLRDGNMEMREAVDEGEEIKAALEEELTEILGDEAYDALGVKFYGERGWEAAP